MERGILNHAYKCVCGAGCGGIAFNPSTQVEETARFL